MDYLNDLPQCHDNHEIQEVAEEEFRKAVSEFGLFLIQQVDKRDYGTDYQLEIKHEGEMTNIRIHVQVKGTECNELANSSISRKVDRTNLNYLLAQENSIYVCYHIPSKRLLSRYAEDVFREYEHKETDWRKNSSITINFRELFDGAFQNKLKNIALHAAKSNRNSRLRFVSTPPDRITKLLQRTVQKVVIPTDYNSAKEILSRLYKDGNDELISNSFEQFELILESSTESMMLVYMAEINLAVNCIAFDSERVKKGISFLEKVVEIGNFELGSILYAIGNGWLGLGLYEKAKEVYHSALISLDKTHLKDIAAQCNKNMGSVLENLGDDDAAVKFYDRALQLDQNLSEAHFAIALSYRRRSNFDEMLEHLDKVILLRKGDRHNVTLQGWRAEALFNIGDTKGAFREINSIVSKAGDYDWVWSWCARQVSDFGRFSLEAIRKSLEFWKLYLKEDPENIQAKLEYLLCFWCLRSNGESTRINYDDFKKRMTSIIDDGVFDTGYLWDRIGHWAQFDGNWLEAEQCYRKAYDIDQERYGYCLGTSLNFLNRYAEALPILLNQAEEFLPDSMGWFQVAVSRESLGDKEGAISAYESAIDFEPDYDLAWFNLGGIYWNSNDVDQATKVWTEAICRFPSHDLAEKLRQDLPYLFHESKKSG